MQVVFNVYLETIRTGSYTSDIADCLRPIVLNAMLGIEIPIMESIQADFRYVMGLTAIEKIYVLDTDEFNEITSLPEQQRLQGTGTSLYNLSDISQR